jgi:hypothetical protein
VFPIDDETLPNFIKRKHPRKGEKKETRGRQPNSPKEVAQKEARNH